MSKKTQSELCSTATAFTSKQVNICEALLFPITRDRQLHTPGGPIPFHYTLATTMMIAETPRRSHRYMWLEREEEPPITQCYFLTLILGQFNSFANNKYQTTKAKRRNTLEELTDNQISKVTGSARDFLHSTFQCVKGRLAATIDEGRVIACHLTIGWWWG